MSAKTIYTIYKATNILNGKGYIGFDSAWPNRQIEHLRSFDNCDFHKAIHKYGQPIFQWGILYQSYDGRHTLKVMEEYFIREHHTHVSEIGYNMTYGGQGSLGRKASLATLLKMSQSLKGRIILPETRIKISLSLKGRPFTEEHKKNLDKVRPRGKNHPNYQKQYTTQERESRRLVLVGKKRPPRSKEWCEKISKAKMGKKIKGRSSK